MIKCALVTAHRRVAYDRRNKTKNKNAKKIATYKPRREFFTISQINIVSCSTLASVERHATTLCNKKGGQETTPCASLTDGVPNDFLESAREIFARVCIVDRADLEVDRNRPDGCNREHTDSRPHVHGRHVHLLASLKVLQRVAPTPLEEHP
jgi:hypothetical protein